MFRKLHDKRLHYLTEWNAFEVKISAAHVKMHLAFKALHKESCCVLFPGHIFRSWSAVVIPAVVRLGFGANECNDVHRTQPRCRGQCWEPEPSQNRWRQSYIAIIWMGWSLWRSECSAAFAVYSHETLKVKQKMKQESRIIVPSFLIL